jgi:hypothetical protein
MTSIAPEFTEIAPPAGLLPGRELRLGQFVGAYQAVDQAPVEYIQGSRTRAISSHLVTGSWSDPWWLYAPGVGWAVSRRWKNKATVRAEWDSETRTTRKIGIPARDELVITPQEQI